MISINNNNDHHKTTTSTTITPPHRQDTSAEMVVACCRFLCYFCRTGRVNQKAMFEHLAYLLDNSCMLLCQWRVVWCGVVWCGVVWRGVVWCGAAWCGVVCCILSCFLQNISKLTFQSIQSLHHPTPYHTTARPSLRGSCPLDVAYSSLMDNNELALALRETDLDKVAVYLSR